MNETTGTSATTAEATDTASTGAPGDVARSRLVEAMTAVVAEKGYAATTIADIVARAHVSRRTFYEQFADKEEIFLACHTLLSDHMFSALETVPVDGVPVEDLIERMVSALLTALAAKPQLTLAHFVEMQAAGVRARQARRAVQDRFAQVVRRVTARAAAHDATVSVPSELLASAVVGGIGELIVQAVENGRVRDLHDLAPTVTELLTAVVSRRR